MTGVGPLCRTPLSTTRGPPGPVFSEPRPSASRSTNPTPTSLFPAMKRPYSRAPMVAPPGPRFPFKESARTGGQGPGPRSWLPTTQPIPMEFSTLRTKMPVSGDPTTWAPAGNNCYGRERCPTPYVLTAPPKSMYIRRTRTVSM